VQGTLDLGNLLGTSWQLIQAWPDCELVIISDAGHDSNGGTISAMVAATDRFAD
jgi:proline iminopeptidase